MALIPTDTRRQAVPAIDQARAPANSGQAPLRAMAELGGAVQSTSLEVTKIATAYKVKKKKADMMADEAKYDLFKQKTLMDARARSAQTVDPKEIAAIYTDAKNQVGGYASKRNADGIKNVRWDDQAPHIQSDSIAFNDQLDEEHIKRDIDVAIKDTVAASETLYDNAVRTGNHGEIDRAGAIQREGGTMSPKQAEQWATDGHVAADKQLVKTAANIIQSKDPIKAQELADAYTASLKDMEYLTPQEIELAAAEFDKAVQLSKYYDNREVERAQKAAQEASYALYNDIATVNPNDLDASGTAATMISGVSFAQANRWTSAVTKYNKIKDLEATDLRTSGKFHQWVTDVDAYSKSTDPDGTKLYDLKIRSMEFGGYGGRAIDALNRVISGETQGKVQGDDLKFINSHLRGQMDLFIANRLEAGETLPAEYVDVMGGTKTKEHSISYMDQMFAGLVKTVTEQTDMNFAQAMDYIYQDPLFQFVEADITFNQLQKTIEAIRQGQPVRERQIDTRYY